MEKPTRTMKETGVKILGDRVIFKPLGIWETKASENKLVIDNKAENPLQKGQVVAVGDETTKVKVGDTIVTGLTAGGGITFNGELYLNLSEKAVIGILPKENSLTIKS